MLKQNPSLLLFGAWLMAVAAMLGSLYFSNILHYPPCDLCYWQRIATYPIVILIFVGLWRKDENVVDYVLPLAVFGFVVAIYHNLIYYKVIPEVIKACANGVSCTTKYPEVMGMSIPLMSLLSYIVMIGLCVAYRRLSSTKN